MSRLFGGGFGAKYVTYVAEKVNRNWAAKVAVFIGAALPTYFVYDNWAVKRKAQIYKDAIGDKVYLDIGIGQTYAGRILIGLYSKTVPLTCENFLQLCKGYRIDDRMIGYRNTFFHMIKPAAMIMGGDVITGTGRSQGLSIYGDCFPDENFDHEFLREGDLAMINWGKNTNRSIFMITLSRQSMFYGHHVVFGTVLKGMRVVREMGELGTRVGRPAMPVQILQCGVIEDDQPPPPPPKDFMPKLEPVMTEDEFRQAEEDKFGVQQPS